MGIYTVQIIIGQQKWYSISVIAYFKISFILSAVTLDYLYEIFVQYFEHEMFMSLAGFISQTRIESGIHQRPQRQLFFLFLSNTMLKSSTWTVKSEHIPLLQSTGREHPGPLPAE
jgi:hypothetical protein